MAKGYTVGDKADQMFFDHISMTSRDKGKTIMKNKLGDPVVVAGEVGKGRVVFDGTFPGWGKSPPEEGEKMTGINRAILVNSVYWLSGREQEGSSVSIEILAKGRRDLVLSQAALTFILFRIELTANRPLNDVAIDARVYRVNTGKLIKEKRVLETPRIQNRWKTDNLITLDPERDYKGEELRLELILSSDGEKSRKEVLFK